MTLMLPPYEPELRLAVTVRLVSTVGATAVQISDVPGWALVRCASFQAKPPPVTDATVWPPLRLGPSEAMKATSKSFADVVESGPEVTLADAAD